MLDFCLNFMKRYFLFALIMLFALTSCCTRNALVKQNVETTIPIGSTLGKVSHQYKDTGCSIVVIVLKEGQEVQTLIPIDIIPSEFDNEGQEIFFNYRTLKIKNPDGCSVGIPAALTEISKK